MNNKKKDMRETDSNQNKSNQVFLLEEIIARMPGYVFWKNKEYEYLGCNDNLVKVSGLKTRQDFIGKTDYDLPWAPRAANFQQDDFEVMSRNQSKLNIEETLIDTVGNISTVLTSKVPLRDRSGEVVGILAISSDITERKKMEEELSRAKISAEVANTAKSEFIANMSHDIRTPLTGIIGLSHILEEEVEHPEEKQHAHWVHESGEQLLALLNGVLEVVSSDETNESDVKHETFDLHDVVQDVLELERAAVKARNLDIKTHIEGAVPHYVVSDRMKLHRILLNLIGNAIKFTKEGFVSIDVKLVSKTATKATIAFQVEDTGIGIPPELQEKVFERFFKANPSYEGIYTGSGLGLHIAQKFVSLLGGESISLRSEFGVGTVFSFVLTMDIGKQVDCKPKKPNMQQPILKATSSEIPIPLISRKEQDALPQVLIIEDNMLARMVLKEMVKTLEAEVIEASDAESALALIKANRFDLIVTDIGLPGQSGIELTEDVRQWEKENHESPTPIIGLTGHAREEVARQCLDAGMSQVYSKPLNEVTLKQILKEYVSTEK